MRKWLLALVLPLLLSDWAYSQTLLKGTVGEKGTGAPVPHAIVSLVNALQGTVEAYTVADGQGRFILSAELSPGEFLLRATALGFEPASLALEPAGPGTYAFQLQRASFELREVVVTAPPVRQLGDTVDFQVDAFAGPKDRAIADVLKKLPGIEVERDGRILYEGKPIQHFYIEGMDLLGGRYNLASNNLPSASVASVQVLENHQPIRILDSLVSSQRASLNLRLRKGTTFTGAGRAGVGAAPALWDANLTPMLFSGDRQGVATFQTNNMGEDLSREVKTLSLEELLEQAETHTLRQDLLGIQLLRSPQGVSGPRHLFNRSHLLSANYLFPLEGGTQVRANAFFMSDLTRQEGLTESALYFPEDTLRLAEAKRNSLRTNALQAEVSLVRNTPKLYFKNDLMVKGNWDSQSGLVRTLNGAVAQELSNPYHSISNSFRVILPVKGELVTFSSSLAHQRAPQYMLASPVLFGELAAGGGSPGDVLRQEARLVTSSANHSASLTKGLGRWTFSPRVGVEAQWQHLSTDLKMEGEGREASLGPDYMNSLRYNRYRILAQPEAQYKSERWLLSVKAPLSLWYVSAEDPAHIQAQAIRRLTGEPSASARYTLSPLWSATASFSRAYRSGEADRLSQGYLLRDYRRLQRNSGPIAETVTMSQGAGLIYKNPLGAFFSSIRYAYALMDYNLAFRNLPQPDGSMVREAVALPNLASRHLVAAQASKYVSPIRTTFRLGSSLTLQEGRQLLGGGLTDIRTRGVTTDLAINGQWSDWMGFEYQALVTLSESTIGGVRPSVLRYVEQSVGIHLFPAENHLLSLQGDAFANRLDFSGRSDYFIDMAYRYSIPGKRLDLELKWCNVLGDTSLIRVYADEFSIITDHYSLRPSQLSIMVKYSL